jgi:uroporphyrinogen-III decarboxylase
VDRGWSPIAEHVVEVEIAFARAQVAAGADIIGLGDAVASQVSRRAYRRFALPYEQRIFAAIHEMGALARLHICGDTSHLLADMAETSAEIIDVDWMVDMGRAAEVFGPRQSVCGNRIHGGDTRDTGIRPTGDAGVRTLADRAASARPAGDP